VKSQLSHGLYPPVLKTLKKIQISQLIKETIVWLFKSDCGNLFKVFYCLLKMLYNRWSIEFDKIEIINRNIAFDSIWARKSSIFNFFFI